MNKKQLRNSILALSFCFSAWMMPGTEVWAAPSEIIIDANQSKSLDFYSGISRVAVANPAIADVTVVSGSQLLIVAKSVGSTTLYIWDGGGNQSIYNVVITNQDVATGGAIQHIIGYPGVKVDKIGGQILLSGNVKNQMELQRAENIAKMYSSSVVNMINMSDPSQIRIEARIVEIDRNKTKNLGINWGNASSIDDTTGVVSVNPGSFSFGQDSTNSRWSNTLGNGGTFASINATLNLLIGHGDAKVLSQPHVVTLSGQKASILIGGEMPVPSTNSNGSTNVEWKNYGIELDMEPVADANGLITSKVMASVSTLSSAAGIVINGTSLKGLSTRKAETVISLGSGQTMVIGGLLSSEDTKSMNKIPLLGDIPILGRFFRSVSESHDEKELLIFITPTLVSDTTETRVTEDMRHNLHQITRDQQMLPVVPKITDSNTVIAQDEYTDEDRAIADKQDMDRAVAAKKAREKANAMAAKKAEKLAVLRQAQLDTRTLPAKRTAAYNSAVAANYANNNRAITPVDIDDYLAGSAKNGAAPTWEDKLAALHEANAVALRQQD